MIHLRAFFLLFLNTYDFPTKFLIFDEMNGLFGQIDIEGNGADDTKLGSIREMIIELS